MKTIALDAHSANCTFALFSERGTFAKSLECATSAENLIDVVKSVRGPKRLIVEESHMAAWVKRTLDPYVERLIVCDPQRNKWIAHDDFNNDISSAFKLGKLLIGGFVKEIHHPDEEGAELRRLFLHYHDLNQQLTRFKNKLKAVFRGEAIPTNGHGIYEEENHAEWLSQLKRLPHLRHEARQLFELVDQLEVLKQETHQEMTRRAERLPAYAWIESMPGAGPVVTTGYLALLETPHRFSHRNKVWKYACLAQQRHESDGRVYLDRAGRSGNRALKWVVFTHFHSAVDRAVKPNRFQRKLEALQSRGLAYNVARRHVCRALISTAWTLWRKEEPYRDELSE